MRKKKASRVSSIALRIRSARTAKGWTQAKLAQEIGGMHRNTIWNYETGAVAIPLPVFLKICSVLDLNAPELIGLDAIVERIIKKNAS